MEKRSATAAAAAAAAAAVASQRRRTDTTLHLTNAVPPRPHTPRKTTWLRFLRLCTWDDHLKNYRARYEAPYHGM